MNVAQLGLEQTADGPVLVKCGCWRVRHVDDVTSPRAAGVALLRIRVWRCFGFLDPGAASFMEIASFALCVEDHAVGAHGGERQQIEKCLRGLFARRGRGIGADEMVGHRVRYGGVLKDPVRTDDGALGTHGEMRMAGTRTPKRLKVNV